MRKLTTILGISILAVGMLCGCKTPNNYIIMASGTTLGFDISESLATQTPQVTLAYKRVELALVPIRTNNYTPDALMEFNFQSSFTSQKIYSRVATGPNATTQTPGILMMSKDISGNSQPNGLLQLIYTNKSTAIPK